MTMNEVSLCRTVAPTRPRRGERLRVPRKDGCRRWVLDRRRGFRRQCQRRGTIAYREKVYCPVCVRRIGVFVRQGCSDVDFRGTI
jgi:hypothetical protein